MNNRLHIRLTLRSRLHQSNVLTLLRLFVLGLLIAAAFRPAISQTQGENCAEPQENPYTLGPGEARTRDMTRNQRHVYRLLLKPQQFVHVVVDQKGIDIVVKILDPKGGLVIERDSPNSKFGPEAISVIAQVEGSYYVEVCASKTQPAGSYTLKIEGPRDAMAADESRFAAELSLMEARRLAAVKTANSYGLAIEQFNKAIEIWRALGDSREEGYALCGIGEAQRNLRNFDEAMKHLNLALARLSEAQDFSGQAYVLNETGAAHRDLKNPRDALPEYDRALELRKRINDRWGQAHIYNNIGFLHSKISEQQKAIVYLELALAIWRELDARTQELNTLQNIAIVNFDLGNLTIAFQQFQTILDSCSQSSDLCSLEAYARNSRGVILDTWGETTEALTQYHLALDLFRKADNKEEEARVLDNIGMAFAVIGDTSTALEQFEEALKIREKELKHFDEAVTRSNLGYVRMLLREYPEALNQLRKAQYFSQLSQNQKFEAYTLQRIGAVQLGMEENDKALASYKEALDIQIRIDDRRGQAITLDRIGELYALMGQPEQALTHYQEALKHWNAVGDRQGEALSLYGIARVERSQNKLTEAREKIVKAIKDIESLRTRMTSSRLRMTYLAARQDYYELEIDIRMRLYQATQSKTEMELALLASERARARNLLDLLTEAQADIRQGVDPQLLALERTKRDQLAEKRKQFQTLLNDKHTEEQESAAERELQALTRSFDQTQAEIRKRSPRYASLTQPQPLNPAQIQQLLDDNSVLLEYALGEERSYLWLVTPTDIQVYTLPPRSKIETAAAAFRESITAEEPRVPGEDTLKHVASLRRARANYPKSALELSRMVLSPVLSAIENKRLIIVADGALQYVPFAALPVPVESPSSSPITLIAKHEIVYEPSASALALIQTSAHHAWTKTVAVFADPVFDGSDNRVSRIAKVRKNAPTVASPEFKRALRDAGDIGSVDGSFRLDRLEYSRGEANAIVAAVPRGSFLRALGFDASRTRFLKEDLRQFRIVHLATHGILNTRHPELSGLVFSLVNKRGRTEDGYLRLGDIYNLRLPVDMVVLSACRTGVGELVRGEGLIGLTRGFMHAGAARVVASLWKVEDEATAELMKRFYSNMLQKNMTAAAALRQAQFDLMQSRRSSYLWAGFILQGDWK
jgi:CHAT domain-containing protein/predicted negative regulator of RcsB-dependent stress response